MFNKKLNDLKRKYLEFQQGTENEIFNLRRRVEGLETFISKTVMRPIELKDIKHDVEIFHNYNLLTNYKIINVNNHWIIMSFDYPFSCYEILYVSDTKEKLLENLRNFNIKK